LSAAQPKVLINYLFEPQLNSHKRQ